MQRGFYVWYYVSTEVGVEYGVLNQVIKDSGVSIPTFNQPNHNHSFRRICSNLSADDSYDFTIQSQPDNKDYSHRLAVNSKLEVIADLKMYKKSATLEVEGDPDIEAIVTAAYEAQADLITDQPIRESLRKCIEGPLQGVVMKPGTGGGIYFVPVEYADRLQELVTYASHIEQPKDLGDILSVTKAYDDDDKMIGAALARRLRPRVDETITQVVALQKLDNEGQPLLATDITNLEGDLSNLNHLVERYSKVSPEVAHELEDLVNDLTQTETTLSDIWR